MYQSDERICQSVRFCLYIDANFNQHFFLFWLKILNTPHHEKVFAYYAKNIGRDQLCITTQLINDCAFVSGTEQFLFKIRNFKLQASSFLILLYRAVCIRSCRKTKTGFLTSRMKLASALSSQYFSVTVRVLASLSCEISDW